MPTAMVFALIEVDRYSGEFSKSCTKFTRHGLKSFELSINSDVLNDYPIEMKGSDTLEFYRWWLLNTKRLDNPYANSTLTQAKFDNTNFIIVHNFDNEAGEEGQLAATLKFKNALTEKLILLYMPIFDKKIYFDNHFNVVKN